MMLNWSFCQLITLLCGSALKNRPGRKAALAARDQHLLLHEVRTGPAGGGVGDEVVDRGGGHAADFVAERTGDVRRDYDVRQRP